ncbi:MAG: hypothetical protein ABI811_07705 [Acidobacteriota bacterium]
MRRTSQSGLVEFNSATKQVTNHAVRNITNSTAPQRNTRYPLLNVLRKTILGKADLVPSEEAAGRPFIEGVAFTVNGKAMTAVSCGFSLEATPERPALRAIMIGKPLMVGKDCEAVFDIGDMDPREREARTQEYYAANPKAKTENDAKRNLSFWIESSGGAQLEWFDPVNIRVSAMQNAITWFWDAFNPPNPFPNVWYSLNTEWFPYSGWSQQAGPIAIPGYGGLYVGILGFALHVNIGFPACFFPDPYNPVVFLYYDFLETRGFWGGNFGATAHYDLFGPPCINLLTPEFSVMLL